MASYRLKRFSLADGRYVGNRATLKSTVLKHLGTGAGIGAAIGLLGGPAGIAIGATSGAIIGMITTALSRSIFNEDSNENITTKNVLKSFISRVEDIESDSNLHGVFNTEIYDINAEANRFDVNVKSNEDSMVIYLRKLSKEEEQAVSSILDNNCYHRKNSDYTAEKQKDGSWIVVAKLVSYLDAAEILFDLMDICKFRINFLTK